MSDDQAQAGPSVTIQSTRFGELTVPEDCIISFPTGLIGFPRANRFVMLDYKPPFSWLHSVDDPELAFVVVDGFEFGDAYNLKPPLGHRECDFREEDEFAILVIVTVRSDPRLTTANLKAPLFVNMRNKRGVQVIFDDSRYSTRHALWTENTEPQAEAGQAEGEKEPEK